MTKNFINITPMKDLLLEQLKEKFLNTEHYSTDTITVSLSLKDSIDNVIKNNNITEPQIFVLDTAWLKISKLVQECSGEVAWHGLVQQLPDNKYLIYDIVVFPQEVTAATANGVDGEYEMWVATLPDEIFDNMRCHMHSHVNMGVTPSGTDENYYTNLMTQVQDFYITMIINKSNNYHLRFYDKVHNIVWSELNFEVCMADGTTYKNWYDSVKDNIRTATPNISSSIWNYNTNSASSKKKETCQEGSTKTTKVTTGSGKNTTQVKEYIISSPENEELKFKDLNEATNFIYKRYEPQIKNHLRFQRNHIRTRLAKDGMVCIHPKTLAFIDNADKNERTLAFALRYTDVWEVLQ